MFSCHSCLLKLLAVVLTTSADSSCQEPVSRTESFTFDLRPTPSYSDFHRVASDGSGQHLFALAHNAGIYVSNNYGLTWFNSTAPPWSWYSIAVDATGGSMLPLLSTHGNTTDGVLATSLCLKTSEPLGRPPLPRPPLGMSSHQTAPDNT
jgi:hypothetical protein